MVSDANSDGLVKLYLDLPDDEVVGGEGRWAKPVGPDLYEIRTVPFHGYDLHLNDVVRASLGAPDERPRIREVVRRSGHKTLRVVFPQGTADDRQVVLLTQLSPLGV